MPHSRRVEYIATTKNITRQLRAFTIYPTIVVIVFGVVVSSLRVVVVAVCNRALPCLLTEALSSPFTFSDWQ